MTTERVSTARKSKTDLNFLDRAIGISSLGFVALTAAGKTVLTAVAEHSSKIKNDSTDLLVPMIETVILKAVEATLGYLPSSYESGSIDIAADREEDKDLRQVEATPSSLPASIVAGISLVESEYKTECGHWDSLAAMFRLEKATAAGAAALVKELREELKRETASRVEAEFHERALQLRYLQAASELLAIKEGLNHTKQELSRLAFVEKEFYTLLSVLVSACAFLAFVYLTS